MAPRTLYSIFVLAIIIKLLCGLFLNVYNGPEVFEYEIITDNILNGKGFLYNSFGVEHRAFIQPFYPVFTAIVYYLTNHSQIVMVIIQSIISSLLCFTIYFLSIRFTGKKEAFLAAVLTALHPGLTVYSILKLHPLVFDTLFYLLTIILILRFRESPSNKNALLTGSIIGFALLSRLTILPFVIFSLIYIFFILNNIKTITRIKYLSVICLFAIIIYSPWVIRNYKIFKSFVLMPTSSGENLWAGNNIAASGSAILISGDSVYVTMPEEMRKELNKLDDLNQVKYYNNYFLNFIKGQPLLFFKLFLKKFYYFWWFSPHTGILYRKSWLNIYKIYYRVIALFFMAGVFFALRNKAKAKANHSALFLLFIYMLLISFIHAVVNVDTRHRWTIEPIIIVFASMGFFETIFYLRNCFKKILRRHLVFLFAKKEDKIENH